MNCHPSLRKGIEEPEQAELDKELDEIEDDDE
jgi:hypothetical protein